MVFGCCRLIASMAQPVEPLAPANTFFQVLPPSAVWKTPRSSLSSHRCPAAHARTWLLLSGSTRIFAICSESFSPMLVQFSPPSVDLNKPAPTETLFRIQDSPLPTQTDGGENWTNMGLKDSEHIAK